MPRNVLRRLKPMKKINYKFSRSENGATLIVALILLVALSLLAISSMNTATLDLIMTGNEQYRANALAAAEAGIQKALNCEDFNTNSTTSKTGCQSSSDPYTYTITNINSGAVQASPTGYSQGSGQFGAVYFKITSTAKTSASNRNATAQNIQEVFQVVRNEDSRSCDTNIGTCVLGGP